MDVVRKSIFNFQPCSVHLRGATSNCRILKLGLLISYDHIVEIFIVEILSWHCSKRCLTSETIFFPIHPVLCDYLLGCYFEDSGCLFLVIMYLFLISEITCVSFSYFVVILWMDRYFVFFCWNFHGSVVDFLIVTSSNELKRHDPTNQMEQRWLHWPWRWQPRTPGMVKNPTIRGEVVKWCASYDASISLTLAKYSKSKLTRTFLPPSLARNARFRRIPSYS